MRRLPMTDRWPSILAGLLTISLLAGPVAADDPAGDAAPAPIEVDPPPAQAADSPRPRERPPRKFDFDLEYDLAGQLIRGASRLLLQDPLTMPSINLAELLAQEAATLDPENAQTWHFLHSIATLNENEKVASESVKKLRELEPWNDRVQLELLRKEIEQAQTASARAASYERAIQRDDLPDTIKSRLALDLAVLERRRGRTESFANWLAESIALDRAHTAAAAIAAGYFRLHVNDPVGMGELLLNQFLANPIDISAQVLAGNHFLDHGAYAAAERMFKLAVNSHEAIVLVNVPGDLIADLAIARWGAGRPDAAREEILEYRRKLDNRYRERLLIEEPNLMPMDRANRHAPLPLTVAATEAALRISQGNLAGVESVDHLLDRHEQNIKRLLEEAREQELELTERDRIETARTWLEAAWLAVWLGSEPERGLTFLENAAEFRDVSDRARARIDGWIAYRNGELDRAAELLKPHAEADIAAGLGYAHLLLEQGRKRSGAREMLRIARSQPGTLIGVWAGDQLAKLLGRRAPLTTEAAELDAMVQKLPRYIDRFPQTPTMMVSVRTRPTSSRFSAYEPIILNLEIVNHSSRPLAIDPEGPIMPEIIIIPDVRISGLDEQPTSEPFIVSIDRRIRLEPRQRITIPIDFRRTTSGYVLDRYAVPGAIVSFRTVSNFYITPTGSWAANLLGNEHQTSPISIEGKRLTGEIIAELIDDFAERPDPSAMPEMALALHALLSMTRWELTESQAQWVVNAVLAIANGIQRLDPTAKAWPLWVLPTRPAPMVPFLRVAHAADHHLTHLSVLLFGQHLLTEEDMQRYRDHEDPKVRRLARIVSDPDDAIRFGEEEEPDSFEAPSDLERQLQRLPENNPD